MGEALNKRLEELGFDRHAESERAARALETALCRVKNLLNRSEIPKELENLTVSMAIGEFLREKSVTGGLSEEFDLTAAVKTLREGDTEIGYATEGDSPRQRLEGFLDYLLHGRTEEIYRFRRLAW